jgi:hypothetical protein
VLTLWHAYLFLGLWDFPPFHLFHFWPPLRFLIRNFFFVPNNYLLHSTYFPCRNNSLNVVAYMYHHKYREKRHVSEKKKRGLGLFFLSFFFLLGGLHCFLRKKKKARAALYYYIASACRSLYFCNHVQTNLMSLLTMYFLIIMIIHGGTWS